MTTLALLVLLPSAGAMPSSSGEDSVDSRLTLTSITPVVEGDGSATVRGRLTNTGSRVLSATDVELVSREASSTRADIADWAEGGTPIEGSGVDTTTLDDIAPGDSAPFTLQVSADELSPEITAGAARVSVQTDETAVHTFIGVHRTKEYEPLEVVWGLPLLLPNDPRLFGDPGSARTRAWETATGPDSRLAGLTEEEPDTDEAWLLDPTLLSVPPEPAVGTGETVAAAMNSEREVRSRRASAIRERVVGERTLVLPEADADVAAGAESASAEQVIRPRLRGGRTLAGQLDAGDDVMWPADGLVTDSRARDLERLHPGADAPTLLTQSSALVPSGFTPTGAARTTGGAPLLVSDKTLSSVVGDLSSQSDVTLARQRLVAETSAVLAERPGTPRTLLVVPDRSDQPSAEAYASLRDSVTQIPWLTKGSTADLLEAAQEAPADQVPRTLDQMSSSPTATQTRGPVLTTGRAQQVARDERSVATFASVRPDGVIWRRTVDPSLDQLTSARWRDTPYAFVELHQKLSRTVTLSPQDLVVSSGDVNFFADSGRLQITVVNNTDVELSNLTVDLVSQNPSFRIDDPPEPVTIGPGGRQTVNVQATALAAGQAQVHVVLTTPSGRELTRPATLRVRMRPTGGAIYWAIGGTAVLLLGAGTWRTVRRPRQPTVNEDHA
ncbi:DUF6049 family protein [Janibacter sp. GS2]|uniref:DUF6049 family protein n=1 Tax=Janibacter sp. GS2 TaxID=3442646 RepID=UPI003EB84BF4